MKRLLSIGWLVLALTLAACGGNETPTAVPSSPASASTAPPPIAPTPQATTMPPASPTPFTIDNSQLTIDNSPTVVPTPSPLPTPPPPVWQSSPNGAMADLAAAQNAEFVTLEMSNTGVWQFAPQTFIHPIAFAAQGSDGYLLDGGRVLRFNLDAPSPPQTALQAGDFAGETIVQEPLDLAIAPDGLLALDRAGDTYRMDWPTDLSATDSSATGAWTTERYDRPIRDTSGHYFTAVADGRYLLETNYNYMMRYAPDGEQLVLWTLPEMRGVDLASAPNGDGDDLYVLTQAMAYEIGELLLYRGGRHVGSFKPSLPLERVRQVGATATAVYVLDHGGERLLKLDKGSGRLLTLFQPPPEDPIATFWAAPDDSQLILAGRDRLYFYDQPQKTATITGDQAALDGRQPHDPEVWAALPDLSLPIGIEITQRDLQMPGAPRHYRLGIHAGVDLYWQPDTPIYAMGDGTVVRSDHDYIIPSVYQFDAWRAQTNAAGYTPPEVLESYRGMQLWIEYAGGVISRYAHLRTIDWTLEEGTAVTQSQFVGTIGNSGSPASVASATEDAHMHFELWLDENHYLGQYLRPIETREWMERLFNN